MRGDVKNAGAVCSLQCPRVWYPTSRRPEREGTVRLRREQAADIALTSHAMDVNPEHAHLCMEPDPRWGGAAIAARLKGDPSHVLREECAHLRSRLPTLWSRSDFAATVGSVTETAVRNSSAHHQGT